MATSCASCLIGGCEVGGCAAAPAFEVEEVRATGDKGSTASGSADEMPQEEVTTAGSDASGSKANEGDGVKSPGVAGAARVRSGRVADADDASRPPAALKSFIDLLGYWGEVYQTHKCERRFLEFSSGVPFAQWRYVVKCLKEDFTTRPTLPEDAVSECGPCLAEP